VAVCEWLAWLLRMRREPEVVASVTSRRASHIRRLSTRDDDLSNYSVHGHLANVFETNGGNSRADWVPRQRSSSMPRRGSVRMGRMSSTRIDRIGDNEDCQWRRLPPASADELEPDERTRTSRLLSNILDELRQLTGKVDRDEARQDEVNDWRFAAMVVDRLCLCAFTIFTVVSTFAILLSAPSFHAR